VVSPLRPWPAAPLIAAALWLGAGLCASSVHAADAALAVHPIVVVGGDAADQEHYQALLAREVLREETELVDSERVAATLEAEIGRSCLGRGDACLGELAAKTGAARALLVTASPYAPKLILTARVVRKDGSLVRAIESRAFDKPPGPPRPEAVREALAALLAELELQVPDPSPLVEHRGPRPPQGSTDTTPPPGPTLTQAGAFAAFGLAGACGAAAAALALSAEPPRAELRERMVEGALPAGDPRAIELHRTLQARGEAATALLVSAGIAAGIGGAMWWAGRPPPDHLTASAVLMAGALGVAVHGEF
jgi:hypothetical protein